MSSNKNVSLEDYLRIISEYNLLKKDPAYYIHQYFTGIINDIDLRREEAKLAIDNFYTKLINDVVVAESECKKRIHLLDKIITKTCNDNQQLELNLINAKIQEDFEKVKKNIDEIKLVLLNKTTYKFKAKVINVNEELFGKLIVDKISRLVTSSNDFNIKIWNTNTNELFSNFETLKGHKSSVNYLKSVSETKLASCSFDKTVRVWNTETNECLNSLSLDKRCPSCLTTRDENTLLIGLDNGRILLWNINESRPSKELIGHSDRVTCMEYCYNNHLITCSQDETLRIWDLEIERCKIIHRIPVFSFRYTNPNKLLCSYMNNIRILDLQNSFSCIKILTGHTKGVYSLEVLPDKYLASGSFDNTIRIWDLEKEVNNCVKIINTHDNLVTGLKLLCHDKLVSSSKDKTIKVWSLDTYECLEMYQSNDERVVCLECV